MLFCFGTIIYLLEVYTHVHVQWTYILIKLLRSTIISSPCPVATCSTFEFPSAAGGADGEDEREVLDSKHLRSHCPDHPQPDTKHQATTAITHPMGTGGREMSRVKTLLTLFICLKSYETPFMWKPLSSFPLWQNTLGTRVAQNLINSTSMGTILLYTS